MKLAVIDLGQGPELALGLGARLLPTRRAAVALGLADLDLGSEDPLRRLLALGETGRAWIDAVATGGDTLGAMTLPEASARFLPPILRPGKILAAGRNYRRPGQPATPPEQPGPPIFAKFPNTLVGQRAPVRYPDETRRLDYEVELAVVIGRTCRGITAAEAMACIAGFTIVNDLTMSDVQKREIADGLMLFAKNADDLCPCGPWLVTAEELPDPDSLRLGLSVNGQIRQDGSTADMLHGVAALVAYCSRMTLMPGDIIATGTPGGNAAGRPEPEGFFLRPGDRVEAWIEGIGTLHNTVVAAG